MKKFLSVFVFLSLLVISLNAQIYSKNHRLYIQQTEHFDVVYPEESKETAELILENCENYLADLENKLNTKIYFRLPVAITPDTDSLNAYYSPEPYHRIVLFDTVPGLGMLSVNKDSILKVFYHELTHAVSLGIRSKGWRIASQIFGAFLAPGQIFCMPMFFYEGVTVSLENYDGYGRMNDNFSLNIIRQAKADKKFPSWRKISGARDIYPIGTPPYIFGGAFSFYLQNRYGLEKYAEYWNACGRLNIFKLMQGKFKQVYGISLDEAWKDFEDSIEIPENIRILSDDSLLAKKTFTKYVNSQVVSENNFYYESGEDKNIYRIDLKTKKQKKLLNADTSSVQKISFSSDNKFLAYSYKLKDENEKNTYSIYSIKDGALRKNFGTFAKARRQLRDLTVISSDDEAFLAGVKTEGQKAFLYISPSENNTNFKDEKIILYDGHPFEIADIGKMLFALIVQKDGQWFLDIADLCAEDIYRYRLDFVPSSMRANNGVLSVTYFPDMRKSKEISFAKTALIYPLKNDDGLSLQISLLDENISGGTFQSLLTANSELIFISQFFSHDEIHILNISELNFSEKTILPLEEKKAFSELMQKTEEKILEPDIEDVTGEIAETEEIKRKTEKKYYPLFNMHKGYFLPFPAASTLITGSTEMSLDANRLGFSYYTRDSAELVTLESDAGYDLYNKSIFLDLKVKRNLGNFDLSAFAKVNAKFNSEYQTSGYLNLYTDKSLGKSYRKIIFQDTAGWNFSDWTEQYNNVTYTVRGQALQNVIYLAYSSGLYKFPGYYSIAGLTLSMQYIINAVFAYQDFSNLMNLYHYMTPSILLRLPFLLPFRNPDGITLNFPSYIRASFLPDSKTSDQKDKYFSFNLKTVIFSKEIQTTIGKSNIYLNRFTLKAKYDCDLHEKLIDEIDYENYFSILQYAFDFSNIKNMGIKQSLTLQALLNMNLIMGSATGQVFSLGCDVKYDFETKKVTPALSAFLDL